MKKLLLTLLEESSRYLIISLLSITSSCLVVEDSEIKVTTSKKVSDSGDGSNPGATLSLPTISLNGSPFVFYKDIAITVINPTVTGQQTTYTISPALPNGLSLSSSTGAISGTSSATLATTSFTILATNPVGSNSVSFSMTIGNNFTVNSTADTSDNSLGDGICQTAGAVCTLRAAIEEANSGSLPTYVKMPAGTFSPSGALSPTKKITLEGDGIASTIISGSNAHKIFDVNAAGLEIVLSKMKLTQANSTTPGGAISFTGTKLTLNEVDVSDNTSSSTTQGGGGIYFSGNLLTLTNSIFKNNTLTQISGSLMDGGAIVIPAGSLNVTNCTFDSNSTVGTGGRGGAIYVTGYATILDSTFKNNSSHDSGGAIFTYVKTIIRRSFFSGNQSTSFGSGGAVYLGSTSASSIIENSTFYNNKTLGIFGNGGAVFLVGFPPAIELINNTFIGNAKGSSGYGGGFGSNGGTAINLTNNVFYNNTSTNCGGYGTLTSLGGNVDSGTTCGFSDATDLNSTNPGFLTTTPANNGGSSETFHFDATSPLYNSGISNGCPLVDQRNNARNDGYCDRGAFEL